MELTAPRKQSKPVKIRFAMQGEMPVVSICIIVYNLEEYIETAIESVLMQETDFPCEFIIGEDYSTDNTRAILRKYEEQYPIKVLDRGRNLGYNRNWESVIMAAEGKYIAFFEGDDCWTDPRKLAKQYKALEEHPEAVLCYTNAKIYDTKNPNSNIVFSDKNRPPVYKNKYETIRFCPMPTCTIFFRNVLPKFPEWSLKAHAGDYMQVALLAKYGGIYYIDEVCGLYVHHYNGLSRTIPIQNFYYNDAPLYKHFFDYFGSDPKVLDPAYERVIGAVDRLFHMKQFRLAIKLYWQIPFVQLFRHRVRIAQVLKQGIKIHSLFFLATGKVYR